MVFFFAVDSHVSRHGWSWRGRAWFNVLKVQQPMSSNEPKFKGVCGQAMCRSVSSISKSVVKRASLVMIEPWIRDILKEITLKNYNANKKPRFTLLLWTIHHRKYNSIFDKMFGASFWPEKELIKNLWIYFMYGWRKYGSFRCTRAICIWRVVAKSRIHSDRMKIIEITIWVFTFSFKKT